MEEYDEIIEEIDDYIIQMYSVSGINTTILITIKGFPTLYLILGLFYQNHIRSKEFVITHAHMDHIGSIAMRHTEN